MKFHCLEGFITDNSFNPALPVMRSGTSKLGPRLFLLLSGFFLFVGLGLCCFCSNATLMRSMDSSRETNLQIKIHQNYTGHLEKCEGVILHFWAKIAPNHTILEKIALL